MSLRFLGLLLLFGSLALAPCLKGQIDANTAAGAIDSLKTSGVKADSIAWKYKGVIGAGFNAVQLSNWSGGGQDAVTIRGLFLGMLDYAEQRFSWENDLDLGYSLTKLGAQDFRKADDRIIYVTKASLKQSDLFRWTAFVDFRTQFYLGYNYDQVDSTSESGFLKISNLMAPGYLTGSLGSEWTPIDGFRLMVAPIASRTVFVLDQELADAGAFGVDPGTNVKSDFGAVLNATVLWEIVENVTWKARANAFMRYASPDLWVVTIENAILMKVNSFLSVGFLTDVFYDDKVPVVRNDGTVGPATQLRNQLVIDLTYTLTNF
jgi:hypothetical protein